MHEEGAVTHHGDARAVGGGELGAEHAGNAETHRPESHAADQGIRPLGLAILQKPIVVDADVAHQNGIVRQGPVDFVRGALGIDRA